MDTKQDSATEHNVCEKDLEALKYQCKKIFFKFSKIVESLVEEIDENHKNKKCEQPED